MVINNFNSETVEKQYDNWLKKERGMIDVLTVQITGWEQLHPPLYISANPRIFFLSRGAGIKGAER